LVHEGQVIIIRHAEECRAELNCRKQLLELKSEAVFQKLIEKVVVAIGIYEEELASFVKLVAHLLLRELRVVHSKEQIQKGGDQGSRLVLKRVDVELRNVQQLHKVSEIHI